MSVVSMLANIELQRRHRDRRGERDAPAGRLQPRAKFDVFNGGPAVAFIKTTVAQECFPSHGATTRPKRRSFRMTGPVRKAMQQIPMPGHERLSRRLGVLGAHDSTW